MSGPFDREVERALEHVDPPRARGEFRAQLRERFVHAGADADDLAADPRIRSPRAPRPAAASRWRGWTAAATLIAAGLVLAFFLTRDGTAPRDGSWIVLAATGSIVVDGRPVDSADTAALERTLAGAKLVSTDDGELRLRLADLMLVELGKDSEIVLAGCDSVPRAGSCRAIEALAGSVRVATGPAFDGLSVATPDLDLAITGTALAVDVYDEGTCVCCSEGKVAIKDRETTCKHVLRPGEMAFVFRQPTPCEAGPIIADHEVPLAKLLAAAEGIWGPR